MRFSVDWIDDAENASPEERATVADLIIEISGENACVFRSGETTIDHVTLPVVHIADAIARNWWRLFGGRDEILSLVDWRMGFAPPNLQLSYNGFECTVQAPQHAYENPPIHFWGVGPEVLSREELEPALDTVVVQTLDRLNEFALQETSLADRWRRVTQSRNDAEETAYCEAAGALGVDPYQITERDDAFIATASQWFEGEVLIEFLAGLRGWSNRSQTTAWIGNTATRPQNEARIPAIAELARDAAPLIRRRSRDRAFSAGYRAARAARRALDLTAGSRFRSLNALATRLDASRFRRAVGQPGVRAFVSRHSADDVRIHLPGRRPEGTPAPPAVLFAFARAVGDAICFPDSQHAVVNNLRNAERQATGRAFAAEFLAPIDEVLAMSEGGRDVETIAEDLYVQSEVIERQLENQERIRAACAA